MSKAVTSFYERNSRLFLAFGGGRQAGAIHREVWGPGVETRYQAFSFVNTLIAERLERVAQASGAKSFRVMDLGCGVGGSLRYIATRFPAKVEGVGVTLSGVQVDAASGHEAPPGSTLSYIRADYNALPRNLAGFDAAYAIESFIHGDRPNRFFQEAFRVLLPADSYFSSTIFWSKILKIRGCSGFEKGGIQAVCCQERLLSKLAMRAGFREVEDLNLTSWLRLGRLRDRVIRQIMQVRAIRELSHPYVEGSLEEMLCRSVSAKGG